MTGQGPLPPVRETVFSTRADRKEAEAAEPAFHQRAELKSARRMKRVRGFKRGHCMHRDSLKIWKMLVSLIIISLFSLVFLGAYGLHRLASYNGTVHGALNTLEKSTRAINLARSAQVAFREQAQEWKDLLVSGNDPAYLQKHLEAFHRQHQTTQNMLAALQDLVVELHFDQGMIDNTIMIHDNLLARHTDALNGLTHPEEGAGKAVDTLVAGMARETTNSIDELVEEIVSENHTLQDKLANEADIQLMDAKAKTALCILVAFLVLGAASFSVIQALTGPQARSTEFLEAVAIGQLFEKHLPVASHPEQQPDRPETAPPDRQTSPALAELTDQFQTLTRLIEEISSGSPHAPGGSASKNPGPVLPNRLKA